MTGKQCGNKRFARGRRERKGKKPDPESGVENPRAQVIPRESPETPSGCGSLRTPESQSPCALHSPTGSPAGGSSDLKEPAHPYQPHLWVPHPGPLLKGTGAPGPVNPTYQEHVWASIIPGQQDKQSQQVSFQTGASEKE